MAEVTKARTTAIANRIIEDENNIDLNDYRVKELTDGRIVLMNKIDDNELLISVQGVVTHAEFPHEENLETLLKVRNLKLCSQVLDLYAEYEQRESETGYTIV